MFYADILRRKIERYGVTCWLINTGWVGGPFGVGQRISIRHTRNLLTAALNGSLLDVPYRADPIFGFDVPTQCPDVPDSVLTPGDGWPSVDEYWRRYAELAARYIDNFKRFAPDCPPEVVAAGPRADAVIQR